jgi:glucan phosphoethanolaminetransferase (alkaline phosphatase superfamily)
MHTLHWPLVLLALAGCIIIWLPASLTRLSEPQAFTARSISLLLIYFTLLHMVGAPFPRYSIPLRPLLYGMAMFTLAIGAVVVRARFMRPIVSPEANLQ